MYGSISIHPSIRPSIRLSVCLSKIFPGWESWWLRPVLGRILVVLWLESSSPLLKCQFLSDTFPSSPRRWRDTLLCHSVTCWIGPGSESSSFLGSQHVARIRDENFIHCIPCFCKSGSNFFQQVAWRFPLLGIQHSSEHSSGAICHTLLLSRILPQLLALNFRRDL